jgi:hypothetical protein
MSNRCKGGVLSERRGLSLHDRGYSGERLREWMGAGLASNKVFVHRLLVGNVLSSHYGQKEKPISRRGRNLINERLGIITERIPEIR